MPGKVKTRHGRVLEPAPRGRIPKGLSVRDRMRRKLRTKRGRERYALRMETVEPVFGQIKQGRGFRQFLLRGLAKVNREWLLICAGHNLLKLFRFGAGISGNVRGKGATGNNKESCQAMGSGVFERRPGYVHPHHAGFVATGESWPINRVSWSILRQAPRGQLPMRRYFAQPLNAGWLVGRIGVRGGSHWLPPQSSWYAIVQLPMEERDQRQIVRRIVLTVPHYFWLVREGVPHTCKATFQ